MVLRASLATVATCWHQRTERRQGHDPTTQEDPAWVCTYLHEATDVLIDAVWQVRQHNAFLLGETETPMTGAVRHFEVMLVLSTLSHTLQKIHQRLLSLYPAVAPGLLEDARTLSTAVAAAHPAQEGRTTVDALMDRVEGFGMALRATLGSGERENER